MKNNKLKKIKSRLFVTKILKIIKQKNLNNFEKTQEKYQLDR